MKKINYLCLFALLIIGVGCNKDEIQSEEQNTDLRMLITEEGNEKGKLKTKTDSGFDQTTQSRGGTGFGNEDGDIYDGTGNSNAQPNSGLNWKYLVEFAPGLTASQKNMIRVPYQIAGDLIGFEQCPNNPDRELWTMNPIVSDCPSGTECSRGDNPPKKVPDELREVWYQVVPSCDQ